MKTSESMAKLATGLAAALGEIHNATKDSKNPHFKSSYASLASVIDATKATLAKHGLVVVQSPGWHDGRVTVTTRIIHQSGEWIEGTAEAPVGKPDPQGVGSAVTYLRRYSLAALCGITQEDDDGQAASRPAPAKPAKPAKPAPPAVDLDAAKDALAAEMTTAVMEGVLNRTEADQVDKALASDDADLIARAHRFVADKRKAA
jgi:hypothetical protein